MTTLPSALIEESPPARAASERLLSVDALRGFDMFWIIGAGSLVTAVGKMQDNAVTRFLATQLKHCDWEGFHFYDLIFPLFLFIMGVSMVFSLDKALAQGGRVQAVGRVLRRSLLLLLLGVFYYGGVSHRWPDVQLGGVLPRIALCYLFAALIYCCCSTRLKTIAAISAGLLLGYWALMTWVPFPDLLLKAEVIKPLAAQIHSAEPADLAAATPDRISGSYEEGRNLCNYVDFRLLLGRKMSGYYINEGLLSTLPAIALCLFGIFAGRLLQSRSVGGGCKVYWLILAGATAVGVGFLWSLKMPLIKRIWTSSFVLVAGGYGAILLGVFYLLVDVWKLRRWCQPFVWIGMNSITIYLAASILKFGDLAERFVGGDVKLFLETHVAQGFGTLVQALVGLGLAIWLTRFLYQRKIFLRV
jgi:predicted acyltransferase